MMCLNVWVTGSRVNEVCTIASGDYTYDGEEAWLTVMQHKVSHRKTVPIPYCLYELMVDYIARNGLEAEGYPCILQTRGFPVTEGQSCKH